MIHNAVSVGTAIGDIYLWEVSSREKLLNKHFQVWDIGASSMLLKVCYFPINVIKIQVNDFTLAEKYEFSQSDEM